MINLFGIISRTINIYLATKRWLEELDYRTEHPICINYLCENCNGFNTCLKNNRFNEIISDNSTHGLYYMSKTEFLWDWRYFKVTDLNNQKNIYVGYVGVNANKITKEYCLKYSEFNEKIYRHYRNNNPFYLEMGDFVPYNSDNISKCLSNKESSYLLLNIIKQKIGEIINKYIL